MGELDLKFYLSILKRRLSWIAISVAAMSIAGLVLAFSLPKTYLASARIFVEAPQIPTEMARTTVSTNAVEQLQIIEQEITTRENLLTLAARHKIHEEEDWLDSEIIDDMRARIRFEQLDLDARSGNGATVFSISFRAGDPVLAANVVNDLVKLVLDRNVRLRKDRAGDTMQFFEQETQRLSGRLSELDSAILTFKNTNKDALPDGQDFRRSQQNNLQDRISMLEREESALRSRKGNLAQLFETTGGFGGERPASPEQLLLAQLNQSLSEQLSIFEESSPGILALRARIEAVQKSIKGKPGASGVARGVSEFDIQMADIDDRLKQIAVEKRSIEQKLAAVSRSISSTPENETRLNALQRDRENIQSQYNITVAKLAEASIGEQLEIRAKGGRFSVIERAVPPQGAISPNRRRIAGMGFAGGLALGFGLVALMEISNRSIRRSSEINQLLPGQLLATIPYIHAPEAAPARAWALHPQIMRVVAQARALLHKSRQRFPMLREAINVQARNGR